MSARWKLLTSMFIEPEFYTAESVIDYDGPPNTGMVPMNDEAEAAMASYLKNNPHTNLKPVDDLPKTMAAAVLVPPEEPPVPKAVVKGA